MISAEALLLSHLRSYLVAFDAMQLESQPDNCMPKRSSLKPFALLAISITGDREEVADFLPSYFESGLKVRDAVQKLACPPARSK